MYAHIRNHADSRMRRAVSPGSFFEPRTPEIRKQVHPARYLKAIYVADFTARYNLASPDDVLAIAEVFPNRNHFPGTFAGAQHLAPFRHRGGEGLFRHDVFTGPDGVD